MNGEDLYQVAGGTSIKFHCLLSVLQLKPGNKKEPKGSGLCRLHKAFMLVLSFALSSSFIFIAMNENVA